jgi:predicted amidohydrolase
MNRADAVLSKADPKNLDLLVLPELAFSGMSWPALISLRYVLSNLTLKQAPGFSTSPPISAAQAGPSVLQICSPNAPLLPFSSDYEY